MGVHDERVDGGHAACRNPLESAALPSREPWISPENHLGRFVPNKGNDLAHVGFLKKTLDANWPEIRENMDKDFYKRVRDRLE